MVLHAPLHRFSAVEYHRMVEAGALLPNSHAELIDGGVIDKAPFSPLHIAVVNRLSRSFVLLARDQARVSVQNPVRLDDRTELEPDLALLRRDIPEDRILEAYNARLVVEVAVITEALDRNVKLLRYAEAGIPEAWLVLPEKRTVETFRRPGPGGYGETTLYTDKDSVEVLGASLAVNDVFPPKTA